MIPRPRVWVASIAVAVTSCGLVYDVDELEEDGKACGEVGKKCCPGNECDGNSVCVDESELHDGGSETDAGSCSCDGGAVDDVGTDAAATCQCAARVCAPCGGPLERCCSSEGGGRCNDLDLACDAAKGLCTGCGEPNQKCCKGGVKCAKDLGGLTCQNDVCAGCGTSGQPCCDGNCGVGLACTAGVCVECGAQNQGCCDGLCNAGLICSGDSCQPCGTQGVQCCPTATPCGGGLTCSGGSCQPCGYYGALCCGSGCDSNSLCDGATCKQCCASCKNFGVITVPIYVCQGGFYSNICRDKNGCSTSNKDPCCANGTCTNPNGNGLCH